LQRSATRVVVADSGPLIALGRLDLLPLLAHVFEQAQIPQAVLAECTARPELIDARRIAAAVQSGILTPCDARPIQVPGLEAGESAAIGRALEIEAGLLADDMAARQHAAALGLVVIGTLGVLVQAKRKGLVPDIRALVGRLRDSGQRLSRTAVAAALAAAGETDIPH
jgi:predicted nucleic acid-binding protein